MSKDFLKYTQLGAEHYKNNDYMHGELKWDVTNEHYYETGVKQAVLYLKERTPGAAITSTNKNWKSKGTVSTVTGGPELSSSTQYWGGVAWNGLISCQQTPDGADTEDLYANNEKYLSLRAKEDFGGSLSAYTYPDLWATCDGTATVDLGTDSLIRVRVHGQTRKAFGLSYITQEGNDTSFQDFSQKLHLVYEATASPTDREYSTINDSPEAIEMSWDFETTPIDMTTFGASMTKSSYIEILKKELPHDSATGVCAIWTRLLAALHGWGNDTAADAELMTDYCPAWLPMPEDLKKIMTMTET